ncbi:GGDEF domain-containing protein [Paenibacillus sp. P26]|nr:GGDEF domain-containing protein [Paenibacillus sp. P26]
MDEVINTKGVDFLAGYAAVKETGWGVVSQSPLSHVYDKLKQHIRKLILYMLVPSLVLLAFAIRLARKLANPFVSLADAVSRFSQDGRAVIPKYRYHWNREADVLTKTIIHAMSSVQEHTDQLSQAAMTDPLTGLANRRTLESMAQKWRAEGDLYSVILMDIDHFKLVNDRYGHKVGDEVLKHVANRITSSTRLEDVCRRFGGEEFVVLQRQSEAVHAFKTAERIRIALESTPSPAGEPVTVSIGVAGGRASSNSLADMLQLADQALYRAKHEGRNRTVIADQ